MLDLRVIRSVLFVALGTKRRFRKLDLNICLGIPHCNKKQTLKSSYFSCLNGHNQT